MAKALRLDESLIITRHGAAVLEDVSAAVIADLHIGFEGVMAQKGLFLPKVQLDAIIENLEALISEMGPDILIVAGDLKHEFSKNISQEWSEVRRFLDFVLERVELIVVRGNHDNYLGAILAERGVPFVRKLEMGRWTIVHGHEMLEDWKGTLIMGHEHPSISIRDEVGAVYRFPAFLYSRERRILVLPPQSIYASGTDVSAYSREDLLSPILREFGLEGFEAYPIMEDLGVVDLGMRVGAV